MFISPHHESDIGIDLTTNYDHFMSMDVSPYAGQWVAIRDEKVVAHSSSFKDAYQIAKEKCGRSKPFLAMVPTSDTMIL
jgi:hypothetical protein